MTTIDFTPDGNGRCFHSDDIPLQSIGTLTVKRASTVEFNEQTQLWEVLTADSTPSIRHVLFVRGSREACLSWERTHWEEFT